MASLSWKANLSGTECRIFRGKVIAGLLKTSSWKNEGYGELDGYMLRFRTTGFWQKNTEIFDIDGTRQLGEIEYNRFNGSAKVVYEGQTYKWRHESWTRRKWSIGSDDSSAQFQASGWWRNAGEVENDDVPPPVVLAAFFVQNYFRKISSAS